VCVHKSQVKVFLVIAVGQPSCVIWNGRNHLAPHPDFKGSFLAGDMSLLYGITCNEILVQHNQVQVSTKSWCSTIKFKSQRNPGAAQSSSSRVKFKTGVVHTVQFLRKFFLGDCRGAAHPAPHPERGTSSPGESSHCYGGGWRPHQDTTTGGAHTCEQIMDAGVEQPGQGAGAYSWRTAEPYVALPGV